MPDLQTLKAERDDLCQVKRRIKARMRVLDILIELAQQPAEPKPEKPESA